MLCHGTCTHAATWYWRPAWAQATTSPSSGIVVEPGVDVTSDEAITGLAKRLEQQGTRLDWLVNVAGVMGLDTLDTVDYEDVRRQFEINTIGPLRVVRELRGLLGEGSKVGILTSRVGIPRR